MATTDETAKTVKELVIELVGKVDKVDTKVDGLDDKLSRLDVLVKGSNEYGSTGLVTEVAELRLRVAALEKFRDRALWVSIGFGAASGGGISLLLQKMFGG